MVDLTYTIYDIIYYSPSKSKRVHALVSGENFRDIIHELAINFSNGIGENDPRMKKFHISQIEENFRLIDITDTGYSSDKRGVIYLEEKVKNE